MINSTLENIYKTNQVEDERGNSINVFPVALPKIVSYFLFDYTLLEFFYIDFHRNF